MLKDFKKTIQKHFVGGTFENLIEPEKFNIELINYLLFYNTKKPHKSLNNFSPLNYFLKTYINNPYQSKMLWYSTPYCKFFKFFYTFMFWEVFQEKNLSLKDFESKILDFLKGVKFERINKI